MGTVALNYRGGAIQLDLGMFRNRRSPTIGQEKAIRRRKMKQKQIGKVLVVGLILSVAAALMLAAQDKYTVKVPGGLAFSEFKGYESWQAISMSQNEKAVAVILGNPAMIAAYVAGIPANGKPVPDGAKMAKIHWAPKKNAF